MPAITVTAVDINHAVRRVEELAGAIKRHRDGKRLTTTEGRLILESAPGTRGRPREDKESHENMVIASKKMAIPIAHLPSK